MHGQSWVQFTDPGGAFCVEGGVKDKDPKKPRQVFNLRVKKRNRV